MPDHKPDPAKTHYLTEYQIDVIAWIAAGCTVAEVAEKLGKTRAAINSATNIIRAKLGARSIAQAVSEAYQRGYLIVDKEDQP